MNCLFVVDGVGAGIGKHGVEELQLFAVTRGKTGGSHAVLGDNERIEPAVRAVVDVPDRVRPE